MVKKQDMQNSDIITFLNAFNNKITMKRGVFLIVIIISIFSSLISLVSAVDIGTCQNLTVAGVYTLNTSLVSADGNHCIVIGANDITLDLAGFSISNATGSSKAAVFINTSAIENVTVMNGMVNNSFFGLYTIGKFTNVTNITANNNSYAGFYLLASGSTIFIRNTASNNERYGFNVVNAQATNNTIFNNTAYNNGEAFFSAGINLDTTAGHNISNNIVYDNLMYGIQLERTQNNTISNNQVYNNNLSFYIFNSSNNNLTGNNATNNTESGFFLNFSSNNIILTNNNATGSKIGLRIINSTGASIINFTSVNNSQSQISLETGATANFSGLVNISDYNATNLDFNITDASIFYDLELTNIITNFGYYKIDNATNVTIKAMNLSSSGMDETTCDEDEIYANCTLLTNSSNVINITNTSATASLNLTMYFNISEYSDNATQISIGRNTGLGWINVGQSNIELVSGRIDYSPITTFSTFGVLRFEEDLEDPSVTTLDCLPDPGQIDDTITCNATIIDDLALDVTANVTLPNGTNLSQVITNESDVFTFNFTSTSVAGNYDVYWVVNDSASNSITNITGFTIEAAQESSGGGGGGNGETTPRFERTVYFGQTGDLEIPDLEENLVNNFIFTFDICNSGSCSVTARGLSEQNIQESNRLNIYGQEGIFLAAAEFICSGGTSGTVTYSAKGVLCSELRSHVIHENYIEEAPILSCSEYQGYVRAISKIRECSQLVIWKDTQKIQQEAPVKQEQPKQETMQKQEEPIVYEPEESKLSLGVVLLILLAIIVLILLPTKEKNKHYKK